MGHIQKRRRDKGFVWKARYQAPDGTERSKTFDRKIDAERFLASVETSVSRGDWLDPEAGRTTIAEWAPKWLASKRKLKPKTRAGYDSLLSSRVLPELGGIPLNRLERIHVEEWISGMEDEGLSASRTRQAFNVLAAMLDAAIANGMLGRNVARGVELPRVPKSQRRFLDEAQVLRLTEAVPEDHRALVLVLAYSGMRWGELVALRRSRCDLQRRRLHVLESATQIGSKLSWGLPKTHRQRAVSIPKFVCDELAVHLDTIPHDSEALVFTGPEGEPMQHGSFLHHVWRPAVRRAGVPKDLTPHELRHTAASLLIAQGAGPKSVQAQLGHSTITTTFDVYGHLFEGHLDDVMERLDERWREAVTAHRRPTGPKSASTTLLPRPDEDVADTG